MITKVLNNKKGFTLIEMLIVMLVISVVLIITIPNVAKHNSNINNKGCEAYVKMLQAEVQAYQIDKHKVPTFQDLITDGYLNEDVKGCPNGQEVTIDEEGKVTAVAEAASTQ